MKLYKKAMAQYRKSTTATNTTADTANTATAVPTDPLEESGLDTTPNESEPVESFTSVEKPNNDIVDVDNPQNDDTFYVYEEQIIYEEEEAIHDIPCVISEPVLFRKYLFQSRIMDHLIITSIFFGVALYVLSIAAIILRHHLFIWTVFSPKVLYQFSWTILYQIVVQVLIVGCGVWSIV